MKELFQVIEDTQDDWETQVSFSFLEIYNELIRDLLSDDFPAAPRGGLTLREDEKNRITVAGLSSKQPKSADEVLEYVLLGNSRRSSSPTHANAQSSRSHAVLQVSISRRPKGGDIVCLESETVHTAVSSATLSIIDLAGSERASATQNMGNRMKEGANINKSLLALGNCINALCVAASRGRATGPHIPYRDSKLTRLLKFSLGGNCRTVMIVCVSPCSVHLEDTGNTLKYANRAKNIVTKVSKNLNGVERNITQYLTAIAEKDATIKILEAKLAEKTGALSAQQQRRQQEARAEMAQAKLDLRTKTSSYLAAIVEGATKRVGWDQADIKVAALRNRIAAIDAAHPKQQLPAEVAAERAALVSRAQEEERAYAVDKDVVSNGSKQLSFMDALLRSMQERRFDKLDAEEAESIKVEAKLAKEKANAAISGAREKAYRSAVCQQAEVAALLISGLVRSTASLAVGSKALQKALGDGDGLEQAVEEIAKGMGNVAGSNESILATLGGITGKAGNIPGLYESPPSQTSSSRMSVAGRPASSVVNGTATKSQRFVRRPSVAGNLSTLTAGPNRPERLEAPMSVLKASPAVRRVLGPAAPRLLNSSPRRLAGSPRKRPTAVGLSLRVQSAKKQLRWRDEAGQGEIDDKAVAAQPSPLSESSTGGVDSSPGEISLPTATLTPKAPEVDEEDAGWEDDAPEDSSGDVSPSDGRDGNTSISTTTTSSHAHIRPPIPEWKKNRMMMGKASALLGTLGEANESPDSSLEGEQRVLQHPRLIRLMGPPQRPARSAGDASINLTDSQRMPPPSSIVRPPSFSLFASSHAGPSRPLPRVTQSPAKSSPKKSQRRLSNIGPVRSERKRSRSSMLPSVAENGGMAGILGQNMSPNQASGGSASHSRMSFASPKNSMRRTSSIGTSLGGIAKPRQSISGLTRMPSTLAMSTTVACTSPKLGFAAPTAASVAKVPVTNGLRVSPLGLSTINAKAVPPSLRKIQSMYGLGGGGEVGGGARPVWK